MYRIMSGGLRVAQQAVRTLREFHLFERLLSINPLSCVVSFLLGTFIVFHRDQAPCQLAFRGLLMPASNRSMQQVSGDNFLTETQRVELFAYEKQRHCLLSAEPIVAWRPAGHEQVFLNVKPRKTQLPLLERLLFSRTVYFDYERQDAFLCRHSEQVSYGY